MRFKCAKCDFETDIGGGVPHECKGKTTMNVTLPVSLTRIGDLLCSAFEGGSNYWYRIEKFIKPRKLTFLHDGEHAKTMGREPTVFRHLDYPLNKGGALIVSDAKGVEREDKVKKVRLDLAACERGLQVMATKYPRHFANFMSENDDAETGDVFLQCCLFGELVYG